MQIKIELSESQSDVLRWALTPKRSQPDDDGFLRDDDAAGKDRCGALGLVECGWSTPKRYKHKPYIMVDTDEFDISLIDRAISDIHIYRGCEYSQKRVASRLTNILTEFKGRIETLPGQMKQVEWKIASEESEIEDLERQIKERKDRVRELNRSRNEVGKASGVGYYW